MQRESVLARYRDNFARHLISVALHMRSEVMNAVTEQYGHDRLRRSFEPYITLSAAQGARLSDIAEVLGISRQAANQAANQVVAAGYLERRADPSDGRAKLLVATAKARDLLEKCSREGLRLQREAAQLVGADAVQACSKHLTDLLRALDLPRPVIAAATGEDILPLVASLPRLSDYTSHRLMELTRSRGHPDLKLSFGQVLTAIGPGGGRIQHMADLQDVSKQAISAVASELEELGYIRRDADPRDARQVVLQFTHRGEQLIADSVDAVHELGREFARHIGRPAQRQVEQTLKLIYRKWHLEVEVFGSGDAQATDIRLLARQLSRQLGEQGARHLGELLLTGDIY